MPVGQSFWITYDEVVKVGTSFNVHFAAVEEESRCPVDGECIWQGRFVAEVWVNDAQFTLGTDQPRAKYGSYFIKLQEVDPATVKSNRPVQDKHYRLRLIMEPAD